MPAEPVAVHYTEGMVHGFLLLRTTDGETIAEGDLNQSTHGSRVTSSLDFHFKDGSLLQETVVFSQRLNFRILRYHLVQKWPRF